MKSWVKLYTEINHDPKILTLTWAQRGIWDALLAIAGEIDHRDEEGLETGIVDSIEYTALRIRCDLGEFEEALHAFEERGLVTLDGGMVRLRNYQKRQARPPSARPAAVAKRVKRHRAKAEQVCNEDVTRSKHDVTLPDTDTESDTKSDTESDPDTEKNTLAAGAASESKADYHEIRELWIELFPDKPKPRMDNSTLQSKMKTRMKSAYFRDRWRDALQRASPSKFLNESGWFDLGWFLKNDDNWQKCLNGNYDNKGTQSVPNGVIKVGR